MTDNNSNQFAVSKLSTTGENAVDWFRYFIILFIRLFILFLFEGDFFISINK